jgi:hypothetical protein
MGIGTIQGRSEGAAGDVQGAVSSTSDEVKSQEERQHCPTSAGFARRETEMEAVVAVDSSRYQSAEAYVTTTRITGDDLKLGFLILCIAKLILRPRALVQSGGMSARSSSLYTNRVNHGSLHCGFPNFNYFCFPFNWVRIEGRYKGRS